MLVFHVTLSPIFLIYNLFRMVNFTGLRDPVIAELPPNVVLQLQWMLKTRSKTQICWAKKLISMEIVSDKKETAMGNQI